MPVEADQPTTARPLAHGGSAERARGDHTRTDRTGTDRTRTEQARTFAFQTLDYPGDPAVSGIGIYTSLVAEGLVRRGHRVHVVSRSQGRDGVRVQEGVTVHRVGPARPQFPRSLGRVRAALRFLTWVPGELVFRRRLARLLRQLVEREGVDLLELCDSGAEALLFRPGRPPGPPVLVRLHGPTSIHELADRIVPEAVRRFVRALERRTVLNAGRATTASTGARDVIAAEFGLDPEGIAVIPNPPPFDPRAIAVEADAEEDDLVVFVGRVTAAKGVDRLIEAVPRVRAARPGTRFVIVGPDWPTGTHWPSTTAYLRSLLRPEDAAAVTFTGYVPHDQIADYLRRATVCVFPSVFEVFGLVCLEAMAYGKAIVAGRTGGLRDMLDDGAAGVMYDAAAGDDLAELIVGLLEDPARRRALAGLARRRALEVYDREAIIDMTEDHYLRCLADPGAHRSVRRSVGASRRRLRPV